MTSVGKLDQEEKVVHYLRLAEQAQVPITREIYHTLLHFYAKKRNMAQVSKYVEEMKSKGIEPDVDTHNILVQAYAYVAGEEMGKRLEELKKTVVPNQKTYSILIRQQLLSDNLEQLWVTFEKMKEAGVTPNKNTFGSLIRACGRGTDANRIEDLLHQMAMFGITPDHNIQSALLEAYARNGLWHKCMETFIHMRTQGTPWRPPTCKRFLSLMHVDAVPPEARLLFIELKLKLKNYGPNDQFELQDQMKFEALLEHKQHMEQQLPAPGHLRQVLGYTRIFQDAKKKVAAASF